ncbi:MAG: O-antigen ligase family protein [Candidatus Ancaeobacter aquaticus]|nr:O-antigen ligase family protein [Candidatus Ancaeobacter aquaticus]
MNDTNPVESPISHKVIFGLLLAVFFFVPLIYTPDNFLFAFGRQYYSKLIFTQIILTVICFFALIQFMVKGNLIYIRSKLLIPLILYFFCAFLSIFWSVSVFISIASFFELISYLLLCIISMYFVNTDRKIRQVVLFWKLSMVGLVGVVLWQFMSGVECYGTIGNRNFLAAFVVLTVPVLFVSIKDAIIHKKHSESLLNIVLLIALGGVLFVTKSRGAFIAVLFVVFLYTEIQLLLHNKKIVALLIMLMGVLLAAFVCNSDFFISEIRADVRPYIWSGTLKMIAEHPFGGYGLGTFFIHFPFFRPVEYFLCPKYAQVSTHALNEFLNIWIQSGIFGLFFFITYFVWMSCKMYGYIKRKGYIDLTGGIFLGVIGLFILSFIDMHLMVPSIAIYFWMLTGIIMGKVIPVPSTTKWGMSLRVVLCTFIAVLLGVYVFYGVYKPLRAEVYFGQGMKARRVENWPLVVQNYEKGLQYMPFRLDITYKCAYALSQTGNNDAAIHYYEYIKSFAPYYARVDYNLAILYNAKGMGLEAKGSLLQWLALNPYDRDAKSLLNEMKEKWSDVAATQK